MGRHPVWVPHRRLTDPPGEGGAQPSLRPLSPRWWYPGWYYADWLWRVRGFIDLLLGGVGVRRGRRDPEQLHLGETVDFWRVRRVEPDRLLLLEAEMRLPGRAWLQFEIEPTTDGATIRQTAIFDPWGLMGLFYWYGLYPLHALIFRGMLLRIARRAEVSATPMRG